MMTIDRRREERTEVDEVAYISGDGSSLRCRVRNISEHGAAVELPGSRHMRSRFTLMLESGRVAKQCRLIWSMGNQIGVEFLPDGT